MDYEDLKFRGRHARLQMNEQGPSSYGDLLEELANATPLAVPRPAFGATVGSQLIRGAPFIDDLLFEQHSKMPVMRRQSGVNKWNIKKDPLYQSLSDEDQLQFRMAETHDELSLLHKQATRMRWAKRTMEESSFGANLGAGLVTSVADITTWLEIALGGEFLKVAELASMVNKANKARNIAILAAKAGGAAAASATARESILQADQFDRTGQESYTNIIAEGVFGGLLGGGAGVVKGRLAKRAAKEVSSTVDRLATGRVDSERASEILVKRGVKEPTPEQLTSAFEQAITERNGGFTIGNSTGVKGGLSTGLGWVMKNIFRTPFHRTAMSDFEVARVWSAAFSDIPVARKGVPKALVRQALDTVKSQTTGDMLAVVPRMVDIWKGGASDISRSDFMKYVGKAASYDDDINNLSLGATLTKSQAEAVNGAARELRTQLARVHELGVRTGAWGKNSELGQTAISYFTRVWDQERALNNDGDLKFLIEAWASRTNDERKAAAEAIGETFSGEMTQLDVDSAVSNIKGGRGSVVRSNRTGSAPGQARNFDIPNDFRATTPDGRLVSVGDFLIEDAEHVLEHNIHFVLPRLLLAERFQTRGSLKMAKVKAEIDGLLTKMRDTEDPAEYRVLLGKLDEKNVDAHIAETVSLFEEAGGGQLKENIAAYEAYGRDVVSLRRSLFDAETRHFELKKQLEVARDNLGLSEDAVVEIDKQLASAVVDVRVAKKKLGQAFRRRGVQKKVKGAVLEVQEAQPEMVKARADFKTAEADRVRLLEARREHNGPRQQSTRPAPKKIGKDEYKKVVGGVVEVGKAFVKTFLAPDKELFTALRKTLRVPDLNASGLRRVIDKLETSLRDASKLRDPDAKLYTTELKKAIKRLKEAVVEERKRKPKPSEGEPKVIADPKAHKARGRELSSQLRDARARVRDARARIKKHTLNVDIEDSFLRVMEGRKSPNLDEAVRKAIAKVVKDDPDLKALSTDIPFFSTTTGLRDQQLDLGISDLFKEADGLDKVMLDFVRAKNEMAGLRGGLASTKKLMRPWEDEAMFRATGEKGDVRGVGEELNPEDWTREAALAKAEQIRDRVGVKQLNAHERAVEQQRVMNALDVERDEKVAKIRAQSLGSENTSKKVAKVDKELERVKNAMRIGHERFRNVNTRRGDPGAFAAGLEETFLDLNHMRLMGGVAISSIPDLATSVMWLGMRDWFGGAVQHISTELKRFIAKASKDELGAAFNGAEAVNSRARQALLSGLDSPNIRANNGVLNRTRRAVRQGFNSATRINWWNEQAKRMVATQVQHKVIRLMKKGSITEKEVGFLERFGVGKDMFERWAEEVATHGKQVKEGQTLFELANVKAWGSQNDADAYRQFLTAVANNSVVTLGSLDLPGAFDVRGWRAILQFKSFGIATLNRVTQAGLSADDSHFAQSMVGILTMGYMASELKDAISGRDTSEDTTKDKFMNALDRSGLLGTIMDIDNVADRLSGGLVGLRPLVGASSAGSRYSSRSQADALLGPSIGLIEDLAGVAGSGLRGVDGEKQFSQSDLARVRRSLPFQNLFYLRVLFDRIAAPNINEGSNKIEKALGARFGLPERTR